MTVKAKLIVAAYYGGGPKLSSWNGCSTGGRQGLKEARRFPADYEGIIAGAPANNRVRLMTGIIWAAQATAKGQPGNRSAEKLSMPHSAVMRACNAGDGVEDGVLENPTRCGFDPGTLECTGGDGTVLDAGAGCRGAKEVHPRNGNQLYPGMVRGRELLWGALPLGGAASHFAQIVFKNPAWDYVALAHKLDKGLIPAMDPKLKPFFDCGGKLLQYHGRNDQQISPVNNVDYYNSVLKAFGKRAGESYRLFMQPGVNHCSGGAGAEGVGGGAEGAGLWRRGWWMARQCGRARLARTRGWRSIGAAVGYG